MTDQNGDGEKGSDSEDILEEEVIGFADRSDRRCK